MPRRWNWRSTVSGMATWPPGWRPTSPRRFQWMGNDVIALDRCRPRGRPPTRHPDAQSVPGPSAEIGSVGGTREVIGRFAEHGLIGRTQPAAPAAGPVLGDRRPGPDDWTAVTAELPDVVAVPVPARWPRSTSAPPPRRAHRRRRRRSVLRAHHGALRRVRSAFGSSGAPRHS